MKKISTLSFMTLGICALSLSVNAQLINESFEGTFPPSGWTVDNPDGLVTFTQGTVGKTGSKSAFLDVFNMDANGAEQGQTDALITSAVNLSSVSNPSLTFQRAYQMYSDPATPYYPKDSLYVQISTDGGSTWVPLFDKASTNLITAAVQFNANAGFVPTSSEWAQETVSLSAHATATSAQFKFAFMNDWENNFYLDDIVVAGTGASVEEVNLDAFVNVYPNPSNGNFNVDITANDLGQADIIVYNMLGDEMGRVSYNILSPRRVKFDMQSVPNGLYFVKVMTAEGSSTKKMIINK